MPTKDMRSELAIKRDEWLESEEGIDCLDALGLILTSKYSQLLRIKIEAAFLAGAKADAEVQQEICDKLAGMVLDS
jgi:hypothetical protein